MGKALVIPDCSFVHTIGQVTFEDIHCTAISLPSTANVKEGLSTTISATLTPSNTTDPVTWSSSDETVATVSGGVITGVEEGAAVITATCNGLTATCAVTVESIKLFTKGGMPTVYIKSGELTDMAGMFANTSSLFNIAFGASDGELPVYGISTDVEREWAGNLYPLKIPKGSTRLTVSCPDLAPLIVYFNSKEKSTFINRSEYKVRDCAKVLWGETPSSGTEWSISGWTYDTKTFTIPAIDGIDSITLGLHAKTQSIYDSFDPSTVSITFE